MSHAPRRHALYHKAASQWIFSLYHAHDFWTDQVGIRNIPSKRPFFKTFFYYRPGLFNNGAYVGWFSLTDIEVVARIRIAYQRCFQGFNLWPLARTTAKSFVLFLFLHFTSTNAFYHGRFHHYSCTFMVLAATSPTSSLTRQQVCDTVSEEESFLQKKDIKRLALGRYHWLFFLGAYLVTIGHLLMPM